MPDTVCAFPFSQQYGDKVHINCLSFLYWTDTIEIPAHSLFNVGSKNEVYKIILNGRPWRIELLTGKESEWYSLMLTFDSAP